MLKYPQGSTDGEDLHPVFSVTPLSSFKHTIDLLLASPSILSGLEPSK